MINTILFDLDGTLADTAPDLAAAVNQLRLEADMPALPFASIRPAVSHGSHAMIKIGMGERINDFDLDDIRQRFLAAYIALGNRNTVLFPGMAETLAEIEHRQWRWGIITNKPAHLTEPLIDDLNLRQRSAINVSGDTTPHPKPHPTPMLHACQQLNVKPANCLYIGDAERDIAAARAANMPSLAATWGYLEADDNPANWHANALIDHPSDILTWLDTHA